jgi:hypothetical protein
VNLRLIGHARGNESTHGAEHDRINFSADAKCSQRMAHFVERYANEQHGHQHQAGAQQIWFAKQECE